MPAVRRLAAGDLAAVRDIVCGLPDYFTSDVADRVERDPPYEATRAFWERRGFVYVDTIDLLPGWGPGNPAAIYVAALRPTR